MNWLIILVFLIPAQADQYDEALSHAAKAAYIQTGLEFQVNKYKSTALKLIRDEATKQAYNLGIQKELAILAIGYNLYTNPQYTLNLSNNKSLTFLPDRVILSIGF